MSILTTGFKIIWDFCHSNKCAVVFPCCFNWNYLIKCDVDHLFMWLFAIFLRWCLFKSLAQFLSYLFPLVLRALCVFWIEMFYMCFKNIFSYFVASLSIEMRDEVGALIRYIPSFKDCFSVLLVIWQFIKVSTYVCMYADVCRDCFMVIVSYDPKWQLSCKSELLSIMTPETSLYIGATLG